MDLKLPVVLCPIAAKLFDISIAPTPVHALSSLVLERTSFSGVEGLPTPYFELLQDRIVLLDVPAPSGLLLA